MSILSWEIMFLFHFRLTLLETNILESNFFFSSFHDKFAESKEVNFGIESIQLKRKPRERKFAWKTEKKQGGKIQKGQIWP